MLRGNRLRGNGLKFNSSKHPRGYHGRFIETPDQPKQSLRKARLPQTETGSRRISLGNTTREQKLALLKKFLETERLKQTQIHQDFQKLLKTADNGGATKVFLSKLNRQQLEGLTLAIGKEQGNDVEDIKPSLKRLSEAQLRAVLGAYGQQHSKPEAETEPTPTPPKKTKRSPEDIERDRAAKEAEKKAKAEAEASPVAPAKKVEALRKLLTGSYKDVPDLDYTPKYKLNEEGLPKLPVAGRAYPPAKKSKIEFNDTGLEVWKDQPEYGKMKGKWRDVKNYEYKATISGEEVSLNRNRLSVTFEGERVYGIPSIHTHLRETKDAQLFKDMARYISYVEGSGKIPPPALSWVKTRHGIIYSDQVGYNKKPGEYGVAELHHHEQWARRRFNEITDKLTYNEKTKRFEDGEITVDEARRQMADLVEPITENGKTYLRIKLQDQADRVVIVLPAGAHNATSKMYEALHPLGVTLDGDPKRMKYGIPDTGEYGRETWFNAWNKRFWTEYYRREVYIMRQEIVRRMKKGDITKEQAEQYWQQGMDSVASTYKHKQYQSDNNTTIRKAIIKDFLVKQDTKTT